MVKMRSETPIETTLECIELELTAEEEENLKNKHIPKIKDDKLDFEKPKHVVKKEAIDGLKQKAKDKNVKLEDITDLLTNIL